MNIILHLAVFGSIAAVLEWIRFRWSRTVIVVLAVFSELVQPFFGRMFSFEDIALNCCAGLAVVALARIPRWRRRRRYVNRLIEINGVSHRVARIDSPSQLTVGRL